MQPEAPIPRTSMTAVLALVFGVLAWLALPVLGALGAILCGHLALGEIRAGRGQIEGEGMAYAGLILGWGQVGCAIVATIILVLVFGSFVALIGAIKQAV